MEVETPIRAVCLGCHRRRFDVRGELCPKCREAAASEVAATLLPDAPVWDGSFTVCLECRGVNAGDATGQDICTCAEDLAPLFSAAPPRRLQIFDRDDGALNVHPPEPGPANCCDGRIVYVFVCRGGVSRCTRCDAKHTMRGAA